MMWKSLSIFLGPVVLAAKATAHIAFYDPSMWGFNVTAQSYSYDNRPMVPLMDLTFEEWWFHGHLDHPPHDGDLFELPAGGAAISQLACNKGATKFWASSEGTTDIRQGDYPCPNSPLSAFHGLSDVKGCALAITYNSDVNSVNPEDFAVFSVNQTCVWSVSTEFQVPASMPKCPPGGCICAWFWIHSVDSGSEQMYMNGFRCDVTGATGTKPIGAAKVPRRCGAEPDIGKAADLSNCTTGPKQPLYWFQKERNNMFEGQYSPPYYNDLYHFLDGAQNDIFVDGSSSPSPSSSVSSPVASSSGPALVVLPSSSSSHVSYSMFSSSSRPSSSVVDASKPAPSVGTTTTSVADPSDIPCDSDVESSTGYSPSSHSYPSPTSIPSQNADPSDIPCDSDTDDSPSSHEHHSPKHHSPTSTTSPVADPSDVPCDEDGGSSTSSHPHGHPSPSSKPRARSSEQKRRQNLVSRHFKRRLSREHRI